MLQPFAPNDSANHLEEHIYSTLKKQGSKEANDRRNSLDNDDDDGVYATINFNRNSISVISDHRMNGSDQKGNQRIVSVSNDVHDLYAKIDVNKKKNRK